MNWLATPPMSEDVNVVIPDAGVMVTDSGVAARATSHGTPRLESKAKASRRDGRGTATSWAADEHDRPLRIRGLDLG